MDKLVLVGWLKTGKNSKENSSRRQWAQRKTQLKSSKEHTVEVKAIEQHQEASYLPGMLPSNIVEALAACEKYVPFISFTFCSD